MNSDTFRVYAQKIHGLYKGFAQSFHGNYAAGIIKPRRHGLWRQVAAMTGHQKGYFPVVQFFSLGGFGVLTGAGWYDMIGLSRGGARHWPVRLRTEGASLFLLCGRGSVAAAQHCAPSGVSAARNHGSTFNGAAPCVRHGVCACFAGPRPKALP